jgi:ADP-heptose:LPS heptosyltransferase
MKEHSKDQMKKSVLLFMPGTIGDTIVCLPALRAILRHFGQEANFFVIHETWDHIDYGPRDVLRNFSEIKGYITYAFKKNLLHRFFSYLKLYVKLRQDKYEAVVNLCISVRPFRAVLRDRLFFRLAGVGRLIGFYAYSREILYPRDKNGVPQEVPTELIMRLKRLTKDGIDTLFETDKNQTFLDVSLDADIKIRNWLNINRKRPSLPLVGVCPGCKDSACQWPLSRFKEIGYNLLKERNLELVIIGGRKEEKAGAELIEEWGSGINAAGKLDLLGSTALIKQCSFVIGLDTGTTHISGAIGTRCVVVYGCRSFPGRWLPLGDNHKIIRKKVPCEGCGLHECNIEGHPCMLNISVKEVYKAVESMCEETKISKL